MTTARARARSWRSRRRSLCRDVAPRNRIRFAFWGAEEAGLVGSIAYVQDLVASGEIKKIEANLNFDMLASPNFVRFVYDGDN